MVRLDQVLQVIYFDNQKIKGYMFTLLVLYKSVNFELPVIRGTLPRLTAAPAPPTTWAPRLWPIRWMELKDVSVFSTRKSMNCLFQYKHIKFLYIVNLRNSSNYLLTLYAMQPVERRALQLWGIQYLRLTRTNLWLWNCSLHVADKLLIKFAWSVLFLFFYLELFTILNHLPSLVE